jgi:hypothetical protein
MAFIATAIATALHAQSPIDGNYYWETDPAEKYQKNVDLNIKTAGSSINISLDIVWTPGVHVEIGATVPANQLITQPGSGGTQTYILSFTLDDGFKNKGTGKLTINGNQCALSLTATEVNDSRAARQYSDYSLQRQP